MIHSFVEALIVVWNARALQEDDQQDNDEQQGQQSTTDIHVVCSFHVRAICLRSGSRVLPLPVLRQAVCHGREHRVTMASASAVGSAVESQRL